MSEEAASGEMNFGVGDLSESVLQDIRERIKSADEQARQAEDADLQKHLAELDRQAELGSQQAMDNSLMSMMWQTLLFKRRNLVKEKEKANEKAERQSEMRARTLEKMYERAQDAVNAYDESMNRLSASSSEFKSAFYANGGREFQRAFDERAAELSVGQSELLGRMREGSEPELMRQQVEVFRNEEVMVAYNNVLDAVAEVENSSSAVSVELRKLTDNGVCSAEDVQSMQSAISADFDSRASGLEDVPAVGADDKNSLSERIKETRDKIMEQVNEVIRAVMSALGLSGDGPDSSAPRSA